MTELLRPRRTRSRPARRSARSATTTGIRSTRLLHDGKLDRGQVQAWVLNRFYYQSSIPLKDAAILSRATDPRLPPRMEPAHRRS